MAEDRAEVVAGAVVLAVAVGFLAWSVQTAGWGGGGATYPLTASFRAVDGIAVGSEVRLAGIRVGTITSLQLNPETFFADATIAVDQAIQLPSDSAILISSEGLLGGNYVELVPGGMPDVLAPGDEIEDTQGSVSLVNLLMRFVGAMADDDEAPAP